MQLSKSVYQTIVASVILSIYSSVAFGQWTPFQSSLTKNTYVKAVHFFDDTLGFCLGYSSGQPVIYKTTTSGHSWSKSKTTGGSFPDIINDLSVVSTDTIIAVGGVFDQLYEAIFRTTDAGKTWKTDTLKAGVGSFNCVHFFSPLRGLTCGRQQLPYPGGQTYYDTGYIAYSTDAGSHWRKSSIKTGTDNIGYVTLLNDSVGFAAGTAPSSGIIHNYNLSKVLKTIDGGLTWTFLYGFDSTVLITQMVFTSIDNGYVIGQTGTTNPKQFFARTTDGGISWGDIPLDPAAEVLSLRSIAFDKSGQYGYIVGDSSLILVTTDNGATWNRQTIINSTSKENLQCVTVLKDGSAMAASQKGSFYHSPAPTASVRSMNSPMSITAVYPNPASEECSCSYDLSTTSIATFMLCSLNGEILWKHHTGLQAPGRYDQQISVKGIASGTYVLSLTIGEQSVCRTIIISR